jgi:hypothetical protein
MKTATAPCTGLAPDYSRIWPAILRAGLICGVMDITAAFIHARVGYGVTPPRLLRNVASALLGAGAQQGGWPVAALGLGMHFCIALSAATVFGLLSCRWSLLTRRAVASGLVYGAVVYFVMNYAVLPLVAQFRSLYLPDTKPFVPHLNLIGLGIHLVCVGLPIALTIRRLAPAETAGR